MRLKLLAIASLASTLSTPAIGQSLIDYKPTSKTQDLPTYPVLSRGQNSYTVPLGDTEGLQIRRLVLPADFTLRFHPDITTISWVVDEIVIGRDATIDLSSSEAKPAPPSAPPTQPQQRVCHGGNQGYSGKPGETGGEGRNLVIRGLTRIQNDGSLWIRSDGGAGGDGGPGGEGQQGGGAYRKFPKVCEDRPGGDGGPGGTPGAGGGVGQVNLLFRSTGGPINVSNGVSRTCAPSKRPESATGQSGVIAVFSAEGCSGSGGPRGPRGRNG